jgi:hypothetical protein
MGLCAVILIHQAHKAAAAEADQLKAGLMLAEKRAKSAEAQAEAQIQTVQQEAAVHIERHKQQWKTEFEKRRKLHNLVSAFLASTGALLPYSACLVIFAHFCVSGVHRAYCDGRLIPYRAVAGPAWMCMDKRQMFA